MSDGCRIILVLLFVKGSKSQCMPRSSPVPDSFMATVMYLHVHLLFSNAILVGECIKQPRNTVVKSRVQKRCTRIISFDLGIKQNFRYGTVISVRGFKRAEATSTPNSFLVAHYV